jgi:thioredoxin 1
MIHADLNCLRAKMTYKIFLVVGFLCALAYGQFPPPVQEEKAPFDSSDIIADIILKSKVPVLIDFWATWCMPCKMVSPTIESLKKEYAGKIKVMKINVDVHRKISAYFRVSSIPAIFFVKDRAVVLYLPGLRKKEDYVSAIKQVIALKPTPADSASRKEPEQAAQPPTGK